VCAAAWKPQSIFDLNDFETQILNDLPVGDGKLYGGELIDRLGHGVECLFDVSGQLKVFLEAYLWIGVDLGFSTITLFEASQRFVDEIIVSFDWECVHEAPASIAQTSTGTGGEKILTLGYQDGSGNVYRDSSGNIPKQTYKVEALPIDNDLNLEYLLKNGYFDSEYSTRAEEIALSSKLAGWRTNNAGQKSDHRQQRPCEFRCTWILKSIRSGRSELRAMTTTR
jgi:hypothetical protein